ncbi:carbohydrate ABC transporter permease [Brevibacillus borstelensis]|uniref:carbohydrate ABC transporter permease n=1 Tax=Brevibacillus borstelensis TaxID=45462 RepID=UPI0030BB2669
MVLFFNRTKSFTHSGQSKIARGSRGLLPRLRFVDLMKPFNSRGYPLDTSILFILPGLIGFFVFFIGPFIISLGYAFVDKPVGGVFVGFQNFTELFQNKAYLQGLNNTISFIGVSVPLNVLLSLAVAMLISKVKKYKGLFALIFLIPLVIPSGSMVFFWRAFFDHNGYANFLLNLLGVAKINWLETEYVQFVIVLIFIWKNLGYNMVLFLAGLYSIPKDYYEAAYIDGAGPWQCFRHITAVHLMPTFVLVLIMSIINSFKVFKEIYLITGSYPHESIYMLQHFMNNMFYSLNYQKLATATTVLVLIITLLTKFLLKLERKVSP